jgi:hypothetical protein
VPHPELRSVQTWLALEVIMTLLDMSFLQYEQMFSESCFCKHWAHDFDDEVIC